MNRVLKVLLPVFLSILLIMQIIMLYRNNFKITEKNAVHKKVKNEKSLYDIYNDLNLIKQKQIINAEHIDRGWKIKLQIDGKKDELIKQLDQLNRYKITNYDIYNDNNESYIVLEMICT